MITAEQVLDNAVEILPTGEDGFRKIKETLTRMGVASKTENVLNQSAHILHKQGRYYIMHFKEMYALDGRRTDLSEFDIGRRNRIAQMLSDWNLLTIISKNNMEPISPPSQVRIIKYGDRDNWVLKAKYAIGVRKNEEV